VKNLEEENKEFLSELVKLRKRRQSLEDENKSLSFDNYHIQQEFKKVLEENLAIYLQIGDKNKRGWIKKMYKNINALPEEAEKTVKDVFKKEIVEVV
jgi:regulator of replication initiation timing